MASDPRGGTNDPTIAQRAKATITPAECSAIRLLHSDGYDTRTLGMMFECDQSTARRHAFAECKVHAMPNVGGRE